MLIIVEKVETYIRQNIFTYHFVFFINDVSHYMMKVSDILIFTKCILKAADSGKHKIKQYFLGHLDLILIILNVKRFISGYFSFVQYV